MSSDGADGWSRTYKVTMRFIPEMREALEALAQEQGVSVSQLAVFIGLKEMVK